MAAHTRVGAASAGSDLQQTKSTSNELSASIVLRRVPVDHCAGNADDLVLSVVKLLSLQAVGNTRIGFSEEELSFLAFDKYTSTIQGGMKFITPCVETDPLVPCQNQPYPFTFLTTERPTRKDLETLGSPDWVPPSCRGGGTQEALAECRWCSAGEECASKRELLLPDVSGTILTTGNLNDLPYLEISQGSISVGQNTSLLGDITFGVPDYDWTPEGAPFRFDLEARASVAMWFTPIDADIGLTLSHAGEELGPRPRPHPVNASRLRINIPELVCGTCTGGCRSRACGERCMWKDEGVREGGVVEGWKGGGWSGGCGGGESVAQL